MNGIPQTDAALTTAPTAPATEIAVVGWSAHVKLEAIAHRFYSYQAWEPKVGDYYCVTRPGLALFQVAKWEDGKIWHRTLFDDQGNDASAWDLCEWHEHEFIHGGFMQSRCFVPPHAFPDPSTLTSKDDPLELLKGLIGLGAHESQNGSFRVTLEYDNYHDGARVLDGDGNVLGQCYDHNDAIPDEDPEKQVEWQFLTAIGQAVRKAQQAEIAAKLWVFQMNDCDWWIASSLNEAIVDALRSYGMKVSDHPTPEEILAFDGAELDDPRRLTDEEMDRLIFRDPGVDPDTYEPIERTFREQLARMIDKGDIKPGLFASTEA